MSRGCMSRELRYTVYFEDHTIYTLNTYVFRARHRAVVCLLFAGVTAAVAAPSFRADKNYPNLGLRMRVLGNAEPEPLAQYKTYTYTYTRGDEQFKKDKFSPLELWLATQHAGRWRDNNGTGLTLGRPTHLLPAFQEEHILREDFDRELKKPAAAFDPSDIGSLTAWIADFGPCTPKKPEPLNLRSFSLARAVFFPVEESAMLVYAFQVKTRTPSGQTTPSQWFCAVITIGDGTLKSKVRKTFETQFLAKVAAIPKIGASARNGIRPRTLSTGTSKQQAADIPDHPSRTAARRSVANMKDWWTAETPEYIFLSDIRSSTGKNLVRGLQLVMPALRGAAAQLIPPFKDTTDVSVVRIYETPEAYQQYVGKAYAWSVGVWVPMRRELVILSQGDNGDKTLEIIQHEGFHQYLFYACNMIENAPWFNEGHACFFEAARISRKGKVTFPENSRGSHLMRNLDAVSAHLPGLLKTGYNGFYQGSDETRSLNYTTAWALVYFLRKGAPLEKTNPYAGILDTYLKTLADTRDAEAATTAAFEGVEMPALQKDFVTFWKKNRNSANRFDPLARK